MGLLGEKIAAVIEARLDVINEAKKWAKWRGETKRKATMQELALFDAIKHLERLQDFPR